MRAKSAILFTISIILLTAFTISTVLADELNVPGQYSTIQSAIDNAASLLLANPGNTYSVLVEPRSTPYPVPAGGLVLKSGISVRGRETARTIIDAGGGVAVTAVGVTGVSFKNFTITHASTGISVSGNSAVTIANNVFIETTNTAVAINNSLGSSVINNTFYQNGTAISRDTDLGGPAITNNIFYNSANTIQISQGALAESTITYNLFYPLANEPNGTNYIPNLIITNSDPLFVDPANKDFHIRSSATSTSPCIDQGDTTINDSIDGTTRSDIGAYGGSTLDNIPYIVSGVTATTSAIDAVSLNWAANTAYLVTNTDPAKQGGYNVYYRLNTGATSTVNLPGNATSAVISGLTTTASPPAAPVLNPLGFDNQTLLVSWSSVSNATGYIVYSRETSTTLTTQSAVIQGTSYTLGGLVNGTDYTVWVTAVTQPTYYFAVTAFDSTLGPFIPGISHESAYTAEIPQTLGPQVESLPSTAVTGFPEPYTYNPNLPNKGCFIATAAYGYYDAPQVQALRDFRDRYLETSSAGRTFVRWYYKYGPIGAAALNEHPWLKPMARAALMPAVGVSLFLTRTSSVTQLLALLLFSLITALLVLYKKSLKRGGSR